MSLKIHTRLKNHEFLLQAFRVKTEKMVFSEVVLERPVVEVILLLAVRRPTVTDVTPFVTITTVSIEFVITIETLTAETAFRMSLETALINCTWFMITIFLMLA